ncbi:MAG: GGDEF domain-containing protein [Candidatus Phaeomarinobacter sp.]
MYHAVTPEQGVVPIPGLNEEKDPHTDFTRIGKPAIQMPRETRELIERALTYAAEAQRTISEQKSRIEQLETLSMTDELTGLLNRRGFLDALARALGNAKRHEEAGLLIAIDLDGFKPINDTLGHAAGDAMLKNVADFLSARVRNTDYLARMGGDEFAILMVNGDLAPARHRAIKLKAALNQATANINHNHIPVKASFGIAPYDNNASPEQVMHMADVAMYHDKRRRSPEPTHLRPFAAAE